jgi:hypothetical protein
MHDRSDLGAPPYIEFEAVGRALRKEYKTAELPHHLLTLLIQLNDNVMIIRLVGGL